MRTNFNYYFNLSQLLICVLINLFIKNNSSDEIVHKLEKLKELLDKGILTEEEYQKKKDELFSQI